VSFDRRSETHVIRPSRDRFDPTPNAAFDEIARLATYICQAPAAFVSFIHLDRYWIKAAVGLEAGQARDCIPLAAIALDRPEITIIEDTHSDDRFANQEAVVSSPSVRFYVGIPIPIAPEGPAAGVLSIIDYQPRQLSWDNIQALDLLGAQATRSLRSLRSFGRHLAISKVPASDLAVVPQNGRVEPQPTTRGQFVPPSQEAIANILESITDAFFALDRAGRFTYVNSRAEQIWFDRKESLVGRCIWDEFPETLGTTFESECQRAIRDRVTVHFEEFYEPLGVWLEVRAYPYRDGISVYFRDVTARKQAEMMLVERARLSSLMTAVGLALGQSGSLSRSLEMCADALIQHLDAVAACIWTVDSEERAAKGLMSAENAAPLLELQAAAGETVPPEAFPPRTPLGHSPIGVLAQSGRPYTTDRLTTFPDFLPPDGSDRPRSFVLYPISFKKWIETEQISTFACYPLRLEERLVGVLALFARSPFAESLYGMLEWLANGIAVSIDRAWAKEALLGRREALLFRLASQIRTSLDLDTILETAVSEIRRLLQIDRCHYLWYAPHPKHPTLAVTHESTRSDLDSLLSAEFPFIPSLAKSIKTLQTLQVDDIEIENKLDPVLIELLEQQGITSQLVVPLGTRSGQYGAIACSHSSGPRPWSQAEVELLQAVVDQLAIAIDQAEMYAKTCAAALAAQTQAQQLSEAMQNLKQTEAQLIQNEKMSSLGQMVAGIAHEINNPVNFITGNLSHADEYVTDLLELIELYQKNYPEPSEEIQEQIEDMDLEFTLEDLPKMLASMQMGADRIRKIVVSLRNFSRLDEAEMKSVDLHEGLDNTLLILHSRLKSKGDRPEIKVVKKFGELPPVDCYPGPLNQVFMNLLANAIDALEDAIAKRPKSYVPQITIVTQLLPGGEIEDGEIKPDRALIRIRDNGLGIPDTALDRLFDPFFTTKPVGKGTGMGLSISYQIIVDRHDGVLGCKSKPDEGAEFTIQIPVKQAKMLS